MIGVGSIHQTCLCGSIDFVRVEVERPDGRTYVTAFLACKRCAVMYHAPRREPSGPAAQHGPLFIGADARPAHTQALSAEQQRELMDAVRRANKGKPRRSRRG